MSRKTGNKKNGARTLRSKKMTSGGNASSRDSQKTLDLEAVCKSVLEGKRP